MERYNGYTAEELEELDEQLRARHLPGDPVGLAVERMEYGMDEAEAELLERQRRELSEAEEDAIIDAARMAEKMAAEAAVRLRTETERVERMKKAMGETAAAMLDERAERFLRWLAGWDEDTVITAEALFNKIEFCGAHPGAKESDFYII